MRARPWIFAALTPICCLLLFADGYPVASELLSPTASANVIQVGSGNAATPSNLPDSPPVITLDSRAVHGILGNAVRSAVGEDMGRIVDVIVDRSGDARAAIIDFGGFLGVGSRRIAVDWNAIRFNGLNQITLDMTRDQVKAAPEYAPDRKSIVVLGASPDYARSRMTERIPEH
jgi:PRC-barrel domain protein